MNEQQPQHNPGEQPEHEASREHEPQLRPRVWIGSLADYNNGTLTGEWVDAAVDDEQLIAEAQRIVANSEDPGAEEYAIFDYDDFGDFKVGGYEQLSTIAKVARGIQEHGAAFAAWAQLHDADNGMLDAFENSYLGEYDNLEDWARQVLDAEDIEQRIAHEFGQHLAPYIRLDYEQWAQDAEFDGDIHAEQTPEGRWWMFSTR
ncbi:antirestriction protein ArdA [Flexivirga caeni]|uniref:Antirestriction protein ArdA n=1 Tax=Flexivirga caeni TaxID=2294115 RepID=A0A3M9LUM4_9MICO|nr:antirestriction protein ArdA [Flexivirga caeni]RNI17019.1 antirestriction protein ArdA [Flexivirga caeni]